MTVASLRDEIAADFVEFAWDQWTQMGVSGAAPRVVERRAADPEALILFTASVGHHDPRLLGEVSDWMQRNDVLISRQRLQNLGPDQPTPPAALAGSRKSHAPDFDAPINLAFRLRQIFGRGVQAEVIRVLVTIDAPRVAVGVLNATCGFADRNVREAVARLNAAGVVRISVVGGTRYFAMNRAAWPEAVGSGSPRHFDWIPALGAASKLMRWLDEPARSQQSEYLRASSARQLIDGLEADLRFAGIPVFGQTARGAAYWDEFERTARQIVYALRG